MRIAAPVAEIVGVLVPYYVSFECFTERTPASSCVYLLLLSVLKSPVPLCCAFR